MNREKLETINVSPQESSELIAFHQIKTPQELLDFMRSNTEENLKSFKIYEFETPEFGCDNQEFIDRIVDK